MDTCLYSFRSCLCGLHVLRDDGKWLNGDVTNQSSSGGALAQGSSAFVSIIVVQLRKRKLRWPWWWGHLEGKKHPHAHFTGPPGRLVISLSAGPICAHATEAWLSNHIGYVLQGRPDPKSNTTVCLWSQSYFQAHWSSTEPIWTASNSRQMFSFT